MRNKFNNGKIKTQFSLCAVTHVSNKSLSDHFNSNVITDSIAAIVALFIPQLCEPFISAVEVNPTEYTGPLCAHSLTLSSLIRYHRHTADANCFVICLYFVCNGAKNRNSWSEKRAKQICCRLKS